MEKQTIILSLTLFSILVSACSGNKNDKDYKKGWTLAWEETFKSGKLSDESWCTMSPSKKNLEKYMNDDPALYVFQDKKLVLRGYSVVKGDHKIFKTGGITTKGKKSFRNGRIEVRTKLNPAPGTSVFIKLLPTDEAKNVSVNLMEHFSKDKFVYHSLSSDYTTDGGMVDNPPSNVLVNADPVDYHTYAVEMYADSVVFFIDNTHTKTYPRINPEVEGQFPFFDRDFFLSIGVAIYSEEQLTEKPIDMFIDRIRYYTREEEQ